ncbi:MAG TPA: DUF4173 domain-containing protein [Candidatus Limnocylindrales bacterium]
MKDRLAARIAALAVAIGLAAELLVDRHALGINVAIVVAAVLAAAVATRPSGRRMDSLDLWLAPAALLFAAFVAIRADTALVTIDVIAAVTLVGASIASLAGAAVTRRTLAAGLLLAAEVSVAAGLGATAVLNAIRRSAWGRRAPSRRLAILAPIARGILIGFPIVVVFAVLFAAADPIFASLAGRTLSFQINLDEVWARGVVVLGVAWIAAGLLWLVASGDPELEARSLGAAASAPSMPLRRLGATEALTVLVALDVLFGAFVVLQLAYLFGGQDTVAAGGLTYANYARRGFFELLAVVVLVGALIGGFESAVTARPRTYVVAMLLLVGLSAVVLASSFLRLRLYQDTYGWTELRFYVVASIGFLALSLAAAAWVVAGDRSRWLPHAVSAAGVVVLIAINAVGPQAYTTARNLERATDPGTVSGGVRVPVDTEYLATLQSDAIPELVAAIPQLSSVSRAQVLVSLRQFEERLDRDAPAGDPAAWNLSRQLARQALATLPPR